MLSATRTAIINKLNLMSLPCEVGTIGPDPQYPLQNTERWQAEFLVLAGIEHVANVETAFSDETFFSVNGNSYQCRPLFYGGEAVNEENAYVGFNFIIEVWFKEAL
jgi:hypothetical protein